MFSCLRVEYFDDQAMDQGSPVDKPPNAEAKNLYEPAAIAHKNFHLMGVTMYCDEFPESQRTFSRAPSEACSPLSPKVSELVSLSNHSQLSFPFSVHLVYSNRCQDVHFALLYVVKDRPQWFSHDLPKDDFSVHISVTRWHILTHYTPNESSDPRLFTDSKNRLIHPRMIEKLRW